MKTLFVTLLGAFIIAVVCFAWVDNTVFAEGLDSNTVLLMHFDGIDGGTTFTDESTNNSLLTASGAANTDTAQAKFGASSLALDGSTSYLLGENQANYDFGTGNFTVDFWWRPTTFDNDEYDAFTAYDDGSHANTNFSFFRWRSEINDGNVVFQPSTSGNQTFSESLSTVLNIWTHIALVRSGTDVHLFTDGVLIETKTGIGDIVYGGNLYIGHNVPVGIYGTGWMDELRISDVARWTSGFTPRTQPYSAGADPSTASIIIVAMVDA